MPASPIQRCTQLLNRVADLEPEESAELMRFVESELHKLAEIEMAAQARGHTLQPTALVNEAWLRLVDQTQASFGSRSHFFALAAKVMRSVLVDHARRKRAQKREGSGLRVTLMEDAVVAAGPDLDVLAVHEALEDLAREDAELAQIVELRYFGGLTAPEAAEAMGLSLRSLERGYTVARMWLVRRFEDGSAGMSAPQS